MSPFLPRFVQVFFLNFRPDSRTGMSISYRRHDACPESILIRDFEGKVSAAEIMESWSHVLDHRLIDKKVKGVVNNLTGCELLMDMEGFESLMAFLRDNESLRKIRQAVLCDDPKTIVYPVLGEYREHRLSIRPFTTMDAAVEWILYGNS